MTIPSVKAPGEAAGVVVVDTYLSEALVAKMDRVLKTYRNFKEAKSYKNPIKAQYIALVIGIALVIILSGTWFGFQIAKGITVPIKKLAEGTKAVAAGDLSFRITARANDEIGVLVESFNRMTQDLQVSKAQLEHVNLSLQNSNLELERRRAYIETVLDNIGRFGPLARLFAEATPEQVGKAKAAVGEALKPHAGPEGVRLAGACWLVSAAQH